MRGGRRPQGGATAPGAVCVLMFSPRDKWHGRVDHSRFGVFGRPGGTAVEQISYRG